MSESKLLLWVDAKCVSPWAMSVYVSLQEKGGNFQLAKVDLDRAENLHPAYQAVSLTSRVPCLIDDEWQLSESTAICEYLEQRFPAASFTPIYPKTLTDLSRAREIQAWIRSDCMALRQERPTEIIFAGQIADMLSPLARKDADKLIALVNQCLQPGQPYLFEQWSVVDLDLAIMLKRLTLASDDVPEWQKKYAESQWNRPAVKSWLVAAMQ